MPGFLSHGAHGKPTHHEGGAAPAGKAGKHRQQIMVAGTVVLIALAYLTLKKTGTGGTAASTAAATPTATGAEGGGEAATTAAGNQAYLDSIAGQLSAIQAILKPTTPAVSTGGADPRASEDWWHHTYKRPPVPDVTKPSLVQPSVTNAATTKKKLGSVNPTAGASTASTHYTVKKGDTLSGIAAKFGTTWQALYASNKAVVDKTAKGHGYTSNLQNWIFPGESLTVAKKTVNKPAVTKATLAPATAAAKPATAAVKKKAS